MAYDYVDLRQSGFEKKLVHFGMSRFFKSLSELRDRYGLPAEGKVLVLLPGSRAAEVKLMGPLFLAVAKSLWQKRMIDAAIIPAANAACGPDFC